MKRHLSEHKWFRGIESDDAALRDFVANFGWIMREMYCLSACPDRDKCEICEGLFFNK
ncbi:MAG TPA: hypothetical protein PLA71_00360 [Saccharofermentans sp.]|nr:hypothetical protein [Saccharofermentans sp.]